MFEKLFQDDQPIGGGWIDAVIGADCALKFAVAKRIADKVAARNAEDARVPLAPIEPFIGCPLSFDAF